MESLAVKREVLLTRIPGGLTPGHGGWLIQCLWVSSVGVGNKVTLCPADGFGNRWEQ